VIGRDDLAGHALGERKRDIGAGGGLDGHVLCSLGAGVCSLRRGRPATVRTGVRDPSRARPGAG
jgi:hypothetical protein